MRMMKWIALFVAIAVIASCFFPWVTIESKNISIGGFEATTNVFGKPGMFHTVLISIAIIFILINRNWSIRAAFFVSAFNIAWAFRNFVRLSACEAGICPEKHLALYVMLASSIILPVMIILIKPAGKKQ